MADAAAGMVGRRVADRQVRVDCVDCVYDNFYIDIIAVLCLYSAVIAAPYKCREARRSPHLAKSATAYAPAHRSRSTRSGRAIGARLFKPQPETMAMRATDDPQSCIRSALRRRRRALGLTQDATARLLNMSRLTYHRIESGTRHIHFADLAAICEMFDCAPGELLQDGQLAAAFARAATALLGQAPA
jgi:DNA-binding Xre family transcriptional regulator